MMVGQLGVNGTHRVINSTSRWSKLHNIKHTARSANQQHTKQQKKNTTIVLLLLPQLTGVIGLNTLLILSS